MRFLPTSRPHTQSSLAETAFSDRAASNATAPLRGPRRDESSDSVSAYSYTGNSWTSDLTVSKRTVAETPFAKCELHTVRSEDGTRTFDNWLFMEERDAVNVIVVDARGRFLVFQQRKYAIPGETLSPVGGFVDDGETPYDAAKREVYEELGVSSMGQLHASERPPLSPSETDTDADAAHRRTFRAEDGRISDGDPDWVYLGSYRTMANRGGGFLYSYLLKNAIPRVPGGGTPEFKGAIGDDEAQTILQLTQDEIVEAVATSRFKEVKWAATVSLSLLHLKNGMPGKT